MTNSGDRLRNIAYTDIYEQKTTGFLSGATKNINNHNIGFGLDVEQTNSMRTKAEQRIDNAVPDPSKIEETFPENE